MFSVESKTIDAAFPRGPGATHLPTDRLKLVYRKYKTTQAIPENVTKVNLAFCHGTGMNKSVWKYHIELLYELSQKSTSWKLNSVIALDAAGHCDSALLNKGKLGWSFDWRDGAKDLIEAVKAEGNTTGDFVSTAYSRNIAIGHSLGAFLVTWAGYLEPNLFDSIISIEPVLFYDPAFTPFFTKKIQKLTNIIQDEFPSREAADTWYKKKSFYNVMNKRVLDDFVDDELYEEDGKIKAKATKPAQMATYLTAPYCVEFGMKALSILQIPFMHVVGTEAMWNPQVAVEFIRETVPPHLLETADVEGGDHLLHGDKIEETVTIFKEFIDRRVDWISEHRLEFPEIKYKEDRDAIYSKQWEYMVVGEVEPSFNYGIPRPKL